MSEKKYFICESCGSRFPKWIGKCSGCGEWDSIREEIEVKSASSSYTDEPGKVVLIDEIKMDEGARRWVTEVAQFDRVVGGGIFPGSVGLLGGEPGIGKSTLILQLLGRISKIGKKALYVSGEESPMQIKSRADRLEIKTDGIMLLAESNLSRILAACAETKADFVVIDSIQTIAHDKISSAQGTIAQVRDCSAEIIRFAKSRGVSVLLIGHVNKEGYVAGPKTLEHMVDYVIYLEYGTNPAFRFIHAVKNRFGAVGETGVFKMTARGLAEVNNPNRFLASTIGSGLPGLSYFMSEEGSRNLLLEVQALVGDQARTNPFRQSTGIERNRLTMLTAVIEKYLGIPLGASDIYINISGGYKSADPSADMSVIAAVLSGNARSFLRETTIFIGEISLTGRFQLYIDPTERIREAKSLGFRRIVLPFNAEQQSRLKESGFDKDIVQVESIMDFYEYLRMNSDTVPLKPDKRNQ